MVNAHIAQPANSPETLFASRVWFDRWLAAFGGPESGYWPVAPVIGDPQIAYVVHNTKIGSIPLRVAFAAANSHTPRFDVTGQITPTGRQLQQMIKDLCVSALVFPYLSSSSRLIDSVQSERRLFRWKRDFCEDAPFIDCTGNWHDYFRSRGQSRCTSWQKYERRMLRSGGAFEVLSSWEDISSCLHEVFQIEMAGWKGRAGTSIAQHSAARSFYEGISADLAKIGMLRLFVIRRDGQIIAFQLATLHAGTLSGLKASYLDDFAKESPGQVLQFWITQWAFEEGGVLTYDLLGPSSEYKRRFSTGVERLETLYVFAPSVTGVVAWLRWSLAPRAKQIFVALPNRPESPQVESHSASGS